MKQGSMPGTRHTARVLGTTHLTLLEEENALEPVTFIICTTSCLCKAYARAPPTQANGGNWRTAHYVHTNECLLTSPRNIASCMCAPAFLDANDRPPSDPRLGNVFVLLPSFRSGSP